MSKQERTIIVRYAEKLYRAEKKGRNAYTIGQAISDAMEMTGKTCNLRREDREVIQKELRALVVEIPSDTC